MAIINKTSSTTKVVTADMNVFKTGEIGYTYAAGDSEGGDRLLIGAGGNKSNGKAQEVHVIGGKYYTDMMNHPRGQLHPNSAIITDGDNKINKLIVDNMTIDASEFTTSTGDITINPNSGVIQASTSRISGVVDPTEAQDAATKNYVDTKDIVFVSGDTNRDGLGNVQTGSTIRIQGAWNTNTVRTDLSNNSVKVEVNVDSDLLGLSQLTVDNVKIDGNTLSTTSGDLTIDPSPTGIPGTVIIAGNLQVDGTTTTINSTQLEVDDKNITLAAGAANAAAADSAGIHIDGANADIYYKSSTNTWNFNRSVVAPNITIEGDLEITGEITGGSYTGFDSDFTQKTTDSLSEGSTNLYFTNTRARNALSAVDVSELGQFDYDSATGQFKYYGVTRDSVRGLFAAGGDMSYDVSTGTFSIDVEQVYTKANFDSDLGLASTDVVSEGSTNLYYTNARVNSLLTAGNNVTLTYDSDAATLTVSSVNTTNTDDMVEGSTNLFHTDARVNALINTAFADKSTTDLSEGTNLYYTNARVDSYVGDLIVGGEGIDITHNPNNELIVIAELATKTNKGVAAFDSAFFTVTNGVVELSNFDGGTF